MLRIPILPKVQISAKKKEKQQQISTRLYSDIQSETCVHSARDLTNNLQLLFHYTSLSLFSWFVPIKSKWELTWNLNICYARSYKVAVIFLTFHASMGIQAKEIDLLAFHTCFLCTFQLSSHFISQLNFQRIRVL